MLKKKRQHNDMMPANWEFLRNKVLVILFSDHPNLNETIVSKECEIFISASFYFNFQTALRCMSRFSVCAEQLIFEGCRWNKVLCFSFSFLFFNGIHFYVASIASATELNFKTFQVSECRDLLTSAAYRQSCTRKWISLVFCITMTKTKVDVSWRRGEIEMINCELVHTRHHFPQCYP